MPHLILASVSTGMSDCHDFAELSTEHIYALNLDCLDIESTISLDPCLGCLSRVPFDDNSMHESFVRVSPAKSFLTLKSTLRS